MVSATVSSVKQISAEELQNSSGAGVLVLAHRFVAVHYTSGSPPNLSFISKKLEKEVKTAAGEAFLYALNNKLKYCTDYIQFPEGVHVYSVQKNEGAWYVVKLDPQKGVYLNPFPNKADALKKSEELSNSSKGIFLPTLFPEG